MLPTFLRQEIETMLRLLGLLNVIIDPACLVPVQLPLARPFLFLTLPYGIDTLKTLEECWGAS